MELKPKILFSFMLAFTTTIGFCLLRYSFCYFNVLTMTMHSQFVYYDKAPIKDKDLFNSIVSGLVPFGGLFGNVLAGFIQNKGRRLTLIALSSLFTVSVGISMIFDMYALFVARFLMGVAVGGYNTTAPLFISEFAPISLMGMLSSLVQIQGNIGTTIAFAVAFAAPYSDDADVNTNQNWRLIYALPALFSLTQFVLFVAVFRYDTPKFYKDRGDKRNYDRAMAQIYSNYDSEAAEADDSKVAKKPELSCSHDQLQFPEAPHEHQASIDDAEAPVDRFETHMQMKADANCRDEPKVQISWFYWKALALCMCLAFFHQFTGINAVSFYSNQIFTNGEVGSGPEFKARVGTVIMALLMDVSGVIVMPLIKIMRRKVLLISGEVIMGTCHAFLILFVLINNQVLIILATLIFVIGFNFGVGSIFWVYSGEVLDSKGRAIVGFGLMFFTFVMGTFTNIAFKLLTPAGVYCGFTAIQIICILYAIFLLRETKGKTKEELQRLYASAKTAEVPAK